MIKKYTIRIFRLIVLFVLSFSFLFATAAGIAISFKIAIDSCLHFWPGNPICTFIYNNFVPSVFRSDGIYRVTFQFAAICIFISFLFFIIEKLSQKLISDHAIFKVLFLRNFGFERHIRVNTTLMMDLGVSIAYRISRSLSGDSGVVKINDKAFRYKSIDFNTLLDEAVYAEDDWFPFFKRHADEADVIIMIPLLYKKRGTYKELDYLISQEYLRKTLLIAPPEQHFKFPPDLKEGKKGSISEAWEYSSDFVRTTLGLNIPKYPSKWRTLRGSNVTSAIFVPFEGSYKPLQFISGYCWDHPKSLRTVIRDGQLRASTVFEATRVANTLVLKRFIILLYGPFLLAVYIVGAEQGSRDEALLLHIATLFAVVLSNLTFISVCKKFYDRSFLLNPLWWCGVFGSAAWIATVEYAVSFYILAASFISKGIADNILIGGVFIFGFYWTIIMVLSFLALSILSRPKYWRQNPNKATANSNCQIISST